jgi:hypothetical protein
MTKDSESGAGLTAPRQPSARQVAAGALKLGWDEHSRIATAHFVPDSSLGATEATALVQALSGWIGNDGRPFALFADTKGVRGTYAEYRSKAHQFFKQHRNQAYIAVTNMSPGIRIVADMFRIGTGIQLKGFADAAGARQWLRTKGLAA